MTMIRKIALGCAATALLATSTTPVLAANLGSITSVQNVSGDDLSQSSSDYRRRDRYRHHRDRIDAGDIAAGIGILAGIAIIADIASKSKKNKRRTQGDQYPDSYPQERYPQERYPQDSRQDTRDAVPSGRYNNGNDVGAAVDACARAAEQKAGDNARVGAIDSVTREGSGWQVLGTLSDGDRKFNCATSNGVVDTIRLDDGRDI
jgi:hypothetical protein